MGSRSTEYFDRQGNSKIPKTFIAQLPRAFFLQRLLGEYIGKPVKLRCTFLPKINDAASKFFFRKLFHNVQDLNDRLQCPLIASFQRLDPARLFFCLSNQEANHPRNRRSLRRTAPNIRSKTYLESEMTAKAACCRAVPILAR